MDDRTGEIVSMEEVLKKPLKEQKHFHEIDEKYLPMIEGMNRKQRRDWLSKNHYFKK